MSESIHELTSTFVDICSDNSHPFVFPSRSKRPPLDILKFLPATLRNHDKKVPLIIVDKDGALVRSSKFMKTCHNMNIIFQTKGGDASSINCKSESPNNKFGNITRALLLISIHRKEIWCFAHQYTI